MPVFWASDRASRARRQGGFQFDASTASSTGPGEAPMKSPCPCITKASSSFNLLIPRCIRVQQPYARSVYPADDVDMDVRFVPPRSEQEYCNTPNSIAPISVKDEVAREIKQQLAKMDEPDKAHERFDGAMFQALCENLDLEALAWRIMSEDRKAALETNDKIMEHLIQLCRDDPLRTTLHDWNVRCQNRGIFVGAAYRVVPEWRQSITKINRMLYENKDFQSGVPFNNDLPAEAQVKGLRISDLTIQAERRPAIPYLPEWIARQAKRIHGEVSGLRYVLNHDPSELTALRSCDWETNTVEGANIFGFTVPFASCFGWR